MVVFLTMMIILAMADSKSSNVFEIECKTDEIPSFSECQVKTNQMGAYICMKKEHMKWMVGIGVLLLVILLTLIIYICFKLHRIKNRNRLLNNNVLRRGGNPGYSAVTSLSQEQRRTTTIIQQGNSSYSPMLQK